MANLNPENYRFLEGSGSLIPQFYELTEGMKNAAAICSQPSNDPEPLIMLHNQISIMRSVLGVEEIVDRVPAISADQLGNYLLTPAIYNNFAELIRIKPFYDPDMHVPATLSYRLALHSFLADFSLGHKPFLPISSQQSQKIIAAAKQSMTDTFLKLGFRPQEIISGSAVVNRWLGQIPGTISDYEATDLALSVGLIMFLDDSGKISLKKEEKEFFGTMIGLSRTVDPEGYTNVSMIINKAYPLLAKYFPRKFPSN